jgi:hypothetical protein
VSWSVVLLVAYVLLLHYTTVQIPSGPGSRLQVGFGLQAWTLTEAGLSWIQSNPTITTVQMIKSEAAFSQDRLASLWKEWSIITAGLILIVVFLLAFLTWTAGFALLARQR